MATAIPSIACLGVIGRNVRCTHPPDPLPSLMVSKSTNKHTNGGPLLQNNPLHISIFPSHDPHTNTLQPIRTPLQFSLLLSSTLDIFDLRAKHHAVTGGGGGGGGAAPLSGDYGLLHAVDERLAAYGFETNTGVKFVAVVDTRGRRIDGRALAASPALQQQELGVARARGGSASGAGAGAAAGAGGGGGGPSSSSRSSTAAAAVVGLRESDMKVVFRAMQGAYVRLLQNPFYEPDEHGAAGGGGKRIASKSFEGDMRRIGEGWTVGVTSL